MARINIEDKLFTDARFIALCNKVTRREAIGMIIDAWYLAQRYWLTGEKYIPDEEFKMAGLEPLIDCLFAKKMDNGYYIRGSEEQFEWLKVKQLAGKKSAEIRKKKFGSAQPQKGVKSRTDVEQCSANVELATEPLTLTLTHTLNTNTNTLPQKKSTTSKKQSIGTVDVIARYCELFEQRHGTKAVISGVEAGQLGRLTKSHGKDQAIKIVEAYFKLPDQWIINQCHPVSMIEKQINKILVHMAKREPERRWLEIPTGENQ
jgi:hypothetical protein